MDITKLSNTYDIKYLTEQDIPQIMELCKGNPQYYKHCPPEVSEESIRKDMHALPPKKTKDDKHYFGFFDGNKLVAVMDLIEKYPNENTAFIGFFMMNKAYQGKGIGSRIISDVCNVLKKSFTHIRLGYVSANMQARNFWMKNGFDHTGIQSKGELYTVNILEKTL